jgi:hypothetical protein
VPADQFAYELSWGAAGHVDSQRRQFTAWEASDAIVRLAERVLEMDGNAKIWAAWATLRRIADGAMLVCWTKTSDERPTAEGVPL